MRFVMVWLMGKFDGRLLLTIMCGAGVVLSLVGVLLGNVVGALCIAALSGCISLLFPTIYGVALTGVGKDTKFASSGLVMAIVGGAIAPLVHGSLQDATNPQFAFIFVLVCFLIVGAFGVYSMRHGIDRKAQEKDSTNA
ncbi:hypothetical protein I6J72_09975 [Corynebacterium sp. FDAARGOS 1242]|uniref:hypothetical protein n=1 Tax=Corynebacterium sp. FDAARGOS 1242 TaxID=2778078 RepID=UPI00194F8E7E|nr:hypothetical protein [Corynebacterium sp. FDAARGOS 1242]QRP97490.1 hypothetical protein I6J72_09975 [Corynebacterium sp. FDAARGOS 1242]